MFLGHQPSSGHKIEFVRMHFGHSAEAQSSTSADWRFPVSHTEQRTKRQSTTSRALLRHVSSEVVLPTDLAHAGKMVDALERLQFGDPFVGNVAVAPNEEAAGRKNSSSLRLSTKEASLGAVEENELAARTSDLLFCNV